MKNQMRTLVLAILLMALAVMPGCALAKTRVTDACALYEAMHAGDDGRYDNEIVLANDIVWDLVDYAEGDDNSNMLIFKQDTVLDLNGYTLSLIVPVHDLIEIRSGVSATIKNGTISFDSKTDPEDGYTTSGVVNGVQILFAGNGNGTLTLDGIEMNVDVYPSKSMYYASENIVDMNGGDTLNITGGSFVRFADREDSRYTSVLVNAQGAGNVVSVKDSALSGSSLRSGFVGNCFLNCKNAEINLYNLKGYFIKGDGMTIMADKTVFAGCAEKGIELKDSGVTLKNESVIWQDDGNLCLVIANKNVKLYLDATSELDIGDVTVPSGTVMSDFQEALVQREEIVVPVVVEEEKPQTVELSAASVSALAEAAIEADKPIVLSMGTEEIEIDTKLLKLIEDMGGDTSINMPVKDVQSEKREDGVEMIIEATMTVGDKSVFDFKDGGLAKTFEFKPKAGYLPSDYAVYCVDTTPWERVKADFTNDSVKIHFEHFSTYQIVNEKVMAQNAVALPETGDNSSLLLWTGLLMLSACAFAAGRKVRA